MTDLVQINQIIKIRLGRFIQGNQVKKNIDYLKYALKV